MPEYNNPRFPLINALVNREQRKNSLESKLSRWAESPSQTEADKCDHSVNMVKKAIAADPKLKDMDITVFGKGSFFNRTNIRSDSDVDVGVRLNGLYINTYPENMSHSDFGFVNATYTYDHFRADLASAMVTYFGSDGVTVGSKAIKVHSNTVRVDADVVPHAIHRRYNRDGSYIQGVALMSNGKVIHNWPDQDYANGVAKNDRTARNYKAMVRIIKNLRKEMAEQNAPGAKEAQSYLIACLVWNIPDYYFTADTWTKMLEDCLVYLAERLSDLQNVIEWSEVNDLKYMFKGGQPWTIDSVRAFVKNATAYLRSLK